jgi:hypothetical protein
LDRVPTSFGHKGPDSGSRIEAVCDQAVRSVARHHRAAEAVVETRGRLIDSQPRARISGRENGACGKPAGNVEGDAPVTEVGVAILAGQAPGDDVSECDYPTGKSLRFIRNHVKPFAQKYFCLSEMQIRLSQ